jgi:uncharacterized protein
MQGKIIAVLALGLLAQSAFGQNQRFLSVKGEAEVEVPPDFIELSVRVEAQEDDLDRAKRSVDARMRALNAALAQFEVASGDLVFSGVAVQRVYEFDRNSNQTPAGYRVSRSVEIKLRQIGSYEAFAEQLIAAGTDRIESVWPGLDDETQAERMALEAAGREARAKAGSMAAGVGVGLGAPIEIGEDFLWQPLPAQQNYAGSGLEEAVMMRARDSAAADPLMFVPKNITVRATVWVRFEIQP